MAFPTSPADGDIYTNPDTNRKFIYSSADSLWKVKAPGLADYLSLTGSIATPVPKDALVAAASGTEYEPAQQVSNNFQARKESNYTQYSWPGYIDYPAGALGDNNNSNQLLIHPASPPGTQVYIESRQNSYAPGSTSSTFSYDPGEAFCFSFTVTAPITTASFINLVISNLVPNTDYSSTHQLRLGATVVKGREIDQDTIDKALSQQTSGRVFGLSNAYIYQYSNTAYFSFYNGSYATQFSVGDTFTLIVFNSSSSTSLIPFTVDDWTGITPTKVSGWDQVKTVISPGLTFPSGYTSLQDLSTTGDLPIHCYLTTTASQSPSYLRAPMTSVYDYYEGRHNQIPYDQNMEILSAPVTPTQSQFLTDKYTIYNSSTSALNYWDSGTSSWIAI